MFRSIGVRMQGIKLNTSPNDFKELLNSALIQRIHISGVEKIDYIL